MSSARVDFSVILSLLLRKILLKSNMSKKMKKITFMVCIILCAFISSEVKANECFCVGGFYCRDKQVIFIKSGYCGEVGNNDKCHKEQVKQCKTKCRQEYSETSSFLCTEDPPIKNGCSIIKKKPTNENIMLLLLIIAFLLPRKK